ncbi:MAG: argininosuccinate lyase, partial [Porticoccaceae bacterium]
MSDPDKKNTKKAQTSNANQAWGGRFNEPVDEFVARFTASVNFDQRLYRQDILGSIVHAKML